MKQKYLIAAITACCLFMTACGGMANETGQNLATTAAEITPPSAEDATESLPSEARLLQNLKIGKTLLTKSFCKAGDVNTTLSFYAAPGEDRDDFSSDKLVMSFSIADNATDSAGSLFGYGELMTEKGKTEYQLPVELTTYRNGNIVSQETPSVTLILAEDHYADPLVSVKGGGILEGDYYDRSLISSQEPDVFSRYLCKADLYAQSTENLSVIRNTIFAAHGRKFDSESLNRYFTEQPWYRGTVAPGDFSNSVLSDVEKKNIALIRELEQQDDTVRQHDLAFQPENLAFAPYLSFLDQSQETGIWANLSQATDHGTYWSMPGQLSLPVTVTRNQWEAVHRGEQVDICVNELTGERNTLEYSEDAGYLFFPEGETPDPMTDPSDIGIRYNFETDLYNLWMASDDTIMKPVYEGDLYILKGAVMGWDVTIEGASKVQQEILPVSADENSSMPETAHLHLVAGNALRHNGRGYLTAVYSLGD